ncbi:MAG: hypothetical protein C0597_12880 [Marinilabiliales bacterium]|nr:MAG: hypothetical protein C0597_12880 [Marinilabiliales bacterium]
MARFLIELKEQDVTEIFFPENIERNFKNVKYSFQQILDEIKKSRREKISQKHYFDYIIENIGEGLISFDDDGRVEAINAKAKSLLGIEYLNSIWDLDKIQIGLPSKITKARVGSQELIKTKIKNQYLELLFRTSEVKIEKKHIRIITFQDIKRELELKEVRAWKKLMRVLTHEMMNSLTPITTLSVAIRRILKSNEKLNSINDLKNEQIIDIYKNNEAIENRSIGLLHFINQFRQVWKIPELKLDNVEILPFLYEIKQLFFEEIKLKKIDFQLTVEPENINIQFDKKLIEQVIINLIKNAIEALESNENKEIIIQAKKRKESSLIVVIDNGSGISKTFHEEIFIPFFTTKEKGSGLGLSISKEIMQKHRGEINFESVQEPEPSTQFYLVFPT